MGNERERLEKIGKAIKDKRVETEALKADRDGKKEKRDKLAKVVKALSKAEFDALPKELQKELKEYI